LVGFHLARTITSLAPTLEEKLKRKENIKVLLIDPHSEAVRYVHAALRYPMTLDQFKERIQTSLTIFSQLAEMYPGHLEIHLIDYPIPY
jgi:hypothetical protein